MCEVKEIAKTKVDTLVEAMNRLSSALEARADGILPTLTKAQLDVALSYSGDIDSGDPKFRKSDK